MKVVVIRSPKAVAGLLRLFFGIRKEHQPEG
ncbi:MAG: stage V sporulation protein SpoVM [Oscillospiraceae bacterium]|nr:stage V sporulation protein SpoVM [Oscillospiraceae bacterium]